MTRKFLALSATALVATTVLSTALANTTPRTEIRDPVRGVSFESIEISQMPVNSLLVVEGTFGDTDSLVVGMSALTLDGSGDVDEYILWLRHEGRQWLKFDVYDPVTFEVDGKRLAVEQLRASQPFVGASSRMFEKVEFRLDQAALTRLLQGERVTITLRSDTGTVEKTLRTDEINLIRDFQASVQAGLAANTL